MRRISLLALALSAIAATPVSTPPDTKAQVDAVFREYDRSDSPGCALGVFRDGKILYARGYGMANLELGVANSAQSAFDIGSTGKQFTAFSIHLLARDGKLSLDDDIRKWLPEMPSYGKTITIRHLLHHTSGLRDYIEVMNLQGIQDEDLTTDQDSLEIITRQKAPNFAPGAEYLYSNTGYFLLSVIVQRVSGQSLRDFAAERIFGPLSMRHTQYNNRHTRIIPNRATGYSTEDGGIFGIDMSDWEQNGDGGVLTTVEDLLRWDQNFYEPVVGDARLIEAMQTAGVLNSGEKLEYASGLSAGTFQGLATVSHGGAWVGYRAQLLRFPEQHFSVACLCNLGEANPSRLARQVAEVYLGGRMKKAEPQAKSKGGEHVRLANLSKRFQGLVGMYRDSATNEMIKLGVWDDKLTADVGGRNFPLSPMTANRFVFDEFPGGRREAELEVIAGGSRPRLKVVTAYDDGDTERQTFEPVDAWMPTPEELALLAGRYVSDEVGTTWRLVLEDGNLFVRHRGISREPLIPTVKGALTLDGMQLTFERDAGGKASSFVLDAGRVKGLSFRKQPPAS